MVLELIEPNSGHVTQSMELHEDLISISEDIYFQMLCNDAKIIRYIHGLFYNKHTSHWRSWERSSNLILPELANVWPVV